MTRASSSKKAKGTPYTRPTAAATPSLFSKIRNVISSPFTFSSPNIIKDDSEEEMIDFEEEVADAQDQQFSTPVIPTIPSANQTSQASAFINDNNGSSSKTLPNQNIFSSSQQPTTQPYPPINNHTNSNNAPSSKKLKYSPVKSNNQLLADFFGNKGDAKLTPEEYSKVASIMLENSNIPGNSFTAFNFLQPKKTQPLFMPVTSFASQFNKKPNYTQSRRRSNLSKSSPAYSNIVPMNRTKRRPYNPDLMKKLAEEAPTSDKSMGVSAPTLETFEFKSTVNAALIPKKAGRNTFSLADDEDMDIVEEKRKVSPNKSAMDIDVSPPKSKPTPASSTAASILLNVLDDYIPPIIPKKAKPAQPEKTVVKNPVSEVNQTAGLLKSINKVKEIVESDFRKSIGPKSTPIKKPTTTRNMDVDVVEMINNEPVFAKPVPVTEKPFDKPIVKSISKETVESDFRKSIGPKSPAATRNMDVDVAKMINSKPVLAKPVQITEKLVDKPIMEKAANYFDILSNVHKLATPTSSTYKFTASTEDELGKVLKAKFDVVEASSKFIFKSKTDGGLNDVLGLSGDLELKVGSSSPKNVAATSSTTPSFSFGTISALPNPSTSSTSPSQFSFASSNSPSIAKSATPAKGGFDWVGAGIPKPKGWTCEGCLSNVDDGVNFCPSCEACKPGFEKPAEPKTTFSFGGVPNTSSSINTTTASTPPQFSFGGLSKSPSAPKSAASVTTNSPPSTSTPVKGGFDWGGAGIAKPKGWTCGECLSNVDDGVNICPSCEACKPGFEKPAEPKTTFSFGGVPNTSSSINTTTASTPPQFSFGGLSKSPSAPKSAASVTTNSPPSTSTPVKGGFDWGGAGIAKPKGWTCGECLSNVDDDKVNICPSCEACRPGFEKPAEPKPTFSFGGVSTTSSSNPTSSTSMPKTPQFSFGGFSKTPSAVKSAAPTTNSPPTATSSSVKGGFDWGGAGIAKPKGWTCEGCLSNVVDGVNICPSCETCKPGFEKPAEPKPTFSFGGISTSSSSKPTTTAAATPLQVSFGISSNNPSTANIFTKSATAAKGGFDWGGAGIAKPKGWTCEGCLSNVDDGVSICPSCEACRPGFEKPAAPKPTFSFGGISTNTSSNITTTKSTPQQFSFGGLSKTPSVSISAAPITTNSPTTTPAGFDWGGAGITKPKGWTCEGCLSNVDNDKVNICPSCEACRPGFEKPAESKPAFSFGSSTPNTNTTTTAKPAEPKPSAAPFSFGSATPNTKPTTTQIPVEVKSFGFGSVMSSPKSDLSTVNPFSFGSVKSKTSEGNTTETPTSTGLSYPTISSDVTSEPIITVPKLVFGSAKKPAPFGSLSTPAKSDKSEFKFGTETPTGKPDGVNWSCPICLCPNTADTAVCSCGTVKPVGGITPANSSVMNMNPTTSFSPISFGNKDKKRVEERKDVGFGFGIEEEEEGK